MLFDALAIQEYVESAIQLIMQNITSSTKPEVRNISQNSQKRTELNMAAFSRVVFELHERTDGRTDRQTYSSQYFTPPLDGEVTRKMCSRVEM